jgi:hypothetical protein
VNDVCEGRNQHHLRLLRDHLFCEINPVLHLILDPADCTGAVPDMPTKPKNETLQVGG